ncbi:hypothetical protein TNCV_3646271 [Trichonephila clavipes]|nr:hypothetical protein TNCV_3646271 [Trichonephila clavipes]
MLEKVIENWTSRLDSIRASRGSPMPEIIFRMTRSILIDLTKLCWSTGQPQQIPELSDRILMAIREMKSYARRLREVLSITTL